MSLSHQLAQINIAHCKAPLDSPIMRGFVELLDSINALADASPGFVWRLKSEGGDATSIRAFEDPLIIVNLSVWTGTDALKAYTYRNSHGAAFRKRNDWFHEMTGPNFALWWIPLGHIPTVEEGKQRLEILAKNGPTAESFSFRESFPPHT